MLNHFKIQSSLYQWHQTFLPRLLRWVGVGGLLLGMLAFPWVLSEQSMMLLSGGLIGLGALYSFIKWPPLGIIAAITGGMIVPFDGPSGLNITMVTLALILALWLVNMLIYQKRIALQVSPTLRPLLLLCLVGIVALGFGQLPWFAFAQAAPLGAQIASLSVLILSAGSFLLMGHQVNLTWLQVIVWSFLAFGALYIIGRAVPELRFLVQRIFQDGMDGSLFWIWVVVLAFSQAAFNQRLALHWRLLLALLVLLTFYVAFVATNDWKSGWIPPFIGIVAVLVARSWRFGLALLPVGAIAGVQVLNRLIATDVYSYSTRIDAWVLLADMISDNPLLGLGWANYRWFTPLFPIRGYAVYFNSHNQYVDIVAQTGVVGLICFVWFFVAVGLLGWHLRQRVAPGFAQAYVYAALGGLVATLVAGMLGDWIVPFFYNIGLKGFRASVLAWIFLGGLLTLAGTAKQPRKEVSL